jgi:hypothetical protein
VSFGVVVAALVNLPLVALLAAREGGVRRFLGVVFTGLADWQARFGVDPATSHNRVDAASLISRFLGTALSGAEQLLLTAAVLLVAAIVLHLLAEHETHAARNLAVGIICLATLLVGFHRGYDLVLLTAPFVALLAYGLPIAQGGALQKVGVALFAVPALNWLPSQSLLGAWNLSHPLWLIISSVNSLCLAALFLGYLGLGVRYHLHMLAAPSAVTLEAGTRLST